MRHYRLGVAALAALGTAAFGFTAAQAQNRPYPDAGQQQDSRYQQGRDYRQGRDYQQSQGYRRDRQDGGQWRSSQYGQRYDSGRHGWNGHRRHCWMEWRHHRRIRICR